MRCEWPLTLPCRQSPPVGPTRTHEESVMHRFRIANMNCGGCAKGVTAAFRQADPLAQIEIALGTREASVTSAVDAARLEQALRDAGWQAERIPA